MKPTLTADLVSKMTLLKCPEPGLPYKKWQAAPGANYLIYDQHRDATPVGFRIRVGKKASVFLIEKLVRGKKMKIHVWANPSKHRDYAQPWLALIADEQRAVEIALERSELCEVHAPKG